jgi:ABC-type branched-subunit amino acid transport system substrate-binding protein
LVSLAIPAACGGSEVSPKEAYAANQALQGASAAGVQGATVGTDAGASNPAASGATPGPAGAVPGAPAPAGSAPAAGQPAAAAAGGAPKGKAGVTGVKSASCDGFKNQTGITDSTITIGNASDISGPMPGLFTSSQQATKAFVAYFNATSNICGRKLALNTYDTRTDAGADQQAYAKQCTEVFASVGSMSGFDGGGGPTAQACGLPDIRTAVVTSGRFACNTCFGAQSTGDHEMSNAIADFWIRNYKDVTQKAAYLYINAGAGAENGKTQIQVEKQRGFNFLYTSGVDVAEFNYGPYVQQMKSKGVRWVQFLGPNSNAARLAQAMQSGGFKPDFFVTDPTAYDPAYVKAAGSAGEGTVSFINFTPLTDNQPELLLYRKWLQQVAPGAQPTFFGLFAWSAAKLFAQEALQLGGQLTRASLVAKVRAIHDWTSDGLHPAMDVGGKHPPSCVRFLQLSGGQWKPFGGTNYLCTGYSKAQ